MAEVGLIGTIIGIAGAGIKLSITLYTFSETVSTAHAEIKNVARDVSLTSAVLEELGASLRQDDHAKLYSDSALRTAKDVVKECEVVFSDINVVMGKAMDSSSKRGLKKGKLALSALERLKWPFLQPKMEMLRSNLERLKSTLVLMLNVLTYARDLRAEKKASPKEDDSYQRVLLENLVRANQEATRNYEVLLKTIGPQLDGHSLGQSRSLESETSTLTDQEKALGSATFISLAKRSNLVKELPSSEVVQPATEEERVESTIRACIATIEDALLNFEQQQGTVSKAHAHIDLHLEVQKEKSDPSEDAGIGVHIEVQKDMSNPPEYAQGLPNHWKVMSMIQKKEQLSPKVAPVIPSFQKGHSSEAVPATLEEGYDPHVPNSKSNTSEYNHRTAALQAEIDATVGVLRDNIHHVVSRGEKMDSSDSLQDRTNNLAVSAQGFRRGANRVRSGTPWFIKAWNSLPSTEDAVNSIQNVLPSPAATMASVRQTLQNTGLFMGVETESENTGTVLEYKNTKPEAAPSTDDDPDVPRRPKRTPTFDDFLTPISPSPKPGATFGVAPEREESLLEADKDSEAPEDPADAVIQLLTEWTTVFDE